VASALSAGRRTRGPQEITLACGMPRISILCAKHSQASSNRGCENRRTMRCVEALTRIVMSFRTNR
jgi:hypothetical protein